MKKRILSILLLAAMLITALPLFAFTAFAEETAAIKRTYEAEDYNALYVKEGLVYAADWFKTNEHWGEVGAEDAITDLQEAANAFNAGRWFATDSQIAVGKFSGTVDAAVTGGAFVLNKTSSDNTNASFNGRLAIQLGNSNVDSAMEVVRSFDGTDTSTFFLNDTRVTVSATGELTDAYNIGNNYGWLLKADGTPVLSSHCSGRDR